MSLGRVTLNKQEKKNVNGDKSIDLRNGNLVIHYDRNKNALGVYLVTSFRDSTGKYQGQSTQKFCSLINLETGYLQFEERCSRTTTVGRVLSHLTPGDYKGEEAVKNGNYIEVYRRDKYSIDLSYSGEDNEGWKNE